MSKVSNKPKLWTGSFVSICMVNFFIFVNFHALLPTFPFFVQYLGGDAVAIGVATALFSLSAIVSRPFVGWLIDTKGRCCILIAGLVGTALMPLGYCVSAGIAIAVVLRMVQGAFHAASSNAASTWVTDIVPRKRMGEGLGMYGLSMALSTALAPALGLSLMNGMGFRPLFLVTSLSSILAIAFGLMIKNRNYAIVSKPLHLRELCEPMSLPAAITQFFFMVTYSVAEVFVAIYASRNGLPSGGIYFIFIAISTLLTRILLGRAIDKYGEANLVYTGNVACIASVLSLVLCHNTPCYIISALLLGYSFGSVQPSLQTMAMHAVTPDRRGAANSTFFVAFDLGTAVGGFLAGLLIKLCGYDIMFVAMTSFCVLSLAYYYVFGRNHASSFNPSRRTPHTTLHIGDGREQAEREHLPLVVTISREFGSGGHAIGKALAHKMGVRFYDRELLVLTAEKSGFNVSLIKESEQTLNGLFLHDDPTQAAVFHIQSQIIKEIASQGSCVIVGRLANFILKGRPDCLNVFVYSDMQHRTERIASEYGLTHKQAMELVRQTDKERREHCLHFTGYEWGKFNNYHLMLDSSALGYENSADLILAMVRRRTEENP